MDLSGGPRYLKLSDNVKSRGQIVLIECDSNGDIDSISQRGALLKSNGGAADVLHLCTEEKTLECKYVETTNSLYLVEAAGQSQGEGDENDQRNNRSQQPHTAIAGAGLMSQMEADMSAKHVTPLHVEAHTNFVVETSRQSPPIDSLWNLLQPHQYNSSSLAQGDGATLGVTWHEMRSEIMACDKDIIAGLQKLKAFGFLREGEVWWCAADERLCVETLEHVLLTCIEKGISLANFQAVEIIQALKDSSDTFSQQLGNGECFLRHVLRLYSSMNTTAAFAAMASDQIYPAPVALDPQAKLSFEKNLVSRACMQAVLSAECEKSGGDPGAGRVCVVLSTVQPAWEELFPALHHWTSDAAPCSMEQDAEDEQAQKELFLEGLKGLAVIQAASTAEEQQAAVLFESKLPKEVSQRFKALLQIQPVWNRGQIEPYLDVCDAECSTATELLLKYTRTIRGSSGKPPSYVAR